MPIGTALAKTKKFDLVSLPEGYVVVRRMTYGEELNRSELATSFKVGGEQNNSKNGFQGAIDINTKQIALWDFANLIIEHNITDENDRLLNFKNPIDVNNLDTVIGKEIGECIDEWNSAAKNSEETKN